MRKLYLLACSVLLVATVYGQQKPNVIIIYADDLGYGDVSCYGATKIHTPNIDKLAKNGLLFTNAYATSATCTPSRFSLLTGVYAWRSKGNGIAKGNASLLIEETQFTMPKLFNKAGYNTSVVGKWHLGLGGTEGPDWNGDIKPGPLEVGFKHSYIIPATLDRVPCVFVDGHRIVNLDPKDPITVDYENKVGNWPTGKDHPEMLTMPFSRGHDQTIINGISRIGYMTGGKAAIWDDYTLTAQLTAKAQGFIKDNRSKPFFMYFASPNIHVPRTPNKRFAGKSGLGVRGDVTLEFDWSVGQIMHTLDSLHLTQNTLVILSSDNGPVVDDGYADHAEADLHGHKPAGPLRGGKYSIFEGGTRVPFIASWPASIKPGQSSALISQVDLLRSFGQLVHTAVPTNQSYDSYDMLPQLLGKSSASRPFLMEDAAGLSIIVGDWKYIEPHEGAAYNKFTKTELGNNSQPQLYNIKTDMGEKNNLAASKPDMVKKLAAKLEQVKAEHGYHQ